MRQSIQQPEHMQKKIVETIQMNKVSTGKRAIKPTFS